MLTIALVSGCWYILVGALFITIFHRFFQYIVALSSILGVCLIFVSYYCSVFHMSPRSSPHPTLSSMDSITFLLSFNRSPLDSIEGSSETLISVVLNYFPVSCTCHMRIRPYGQCVIVVDACLTRGTFLHRSAQGPEASRVE